MSKSCSRFREKFNSFHEHVIKYGNRIKEKNDGVPMGYIYVFDVDIVDEIYYTIVRLVAEDDDDLPDGTVVLLDMVITDLNKKEAYSSNWHRIGLDQIYKCFGDDFLFLDHSGSSRADYPSKYEYFIELKEKHGYPFDVNHVNLEDYR